MKWPKDQFEDGGLLLRDMVYLPHFLNRLAQPRIKATLRSAGPWPPGLHLSNCVVL